MVYTWLLSGVPADRIDEVDEMLRQPLPGQEDRVTALSEEDEGASFLNTQARIAGGMR